MGLFDKIKSSVVDREAKTGIIDYGSQKKSGSHDHRTNKGDDRTPAQKRADQTKRKED